MLVVNLSGRGDKDMAQAQTPAGARAMSRYADMFARLRGGEGAFGAFVMLGDPDLETSAAILDALVEGGADMIEVGIPFSDPIADGPVIQAAADAGAARGRRARATASPCSRASARAIRMCRSASSPMPISSSRAAATPSTARAAEAGRRQRAGRRRAGARSRALRRRGARARRRAGADRRRQHAGRSGSRGSPRSAAAIPIASPAPA